MKHVQHVAVSELIKASFTFVFLFLYYARRWDWTQGADEQMSEGKKLSTRMAKAYEWQQAWWYWKERKGKKKFSVQPSNIERKRGKSTLCIRDSQQEVTSELTRGRNSQLAFFMVAKERKRKTPSKGAKKGRLESQAFSRDFWNFFFWIK